MTSYYQIINSEDLKRMYPNINLDTIQLISADDAQLSGQQIVLTQPAPSRGVNKDTQLQQVVYQTQPHEQIQNQIETNYVIEQDLINENIIQSNHSQSQIFYQEVSNSQQPQQIIQHTQQQIPQQQIIIQQPTQTHNTAPQHQHLHLQQNRPVVIQPTNAVTIHHQQQQQQAHQQTQNPQVIYESSNRTLYSVSAPSKIQQPQQQQQHLQQVQIQQQNQPQHQLQIMNQQQTIVQHQAQPQVQPNRIQRPNQSRMSLLTPQQQQMQSQQQIQLLQQHQIQHQLQQQQQQKIAHLMTASGIPTQHPTVSMNTQQLNRFTIPPRIVLTQNVQQTNRAQPPPQPIQQTVRMPQNFRGIRTRLPLPVRGTAQGVSYGRGRGRGSNQNVSTVMSTQTVRQRMVYNVPNNVRQPAPRLGLQTSRVQNQSSVQQTTMQQLQQNHMIRTVLQQNSVTVMHKPQTSVQIKKMVPQVAVTPSQTIPSLCTPQRTVTTPTSIDIDDDIEANIAAAVVNKSQPMEDSNYLTPSTSNLFANSDDNKIVTLTNGQTMTMTEFERMQQQQQQMQQNTVPTRGRGRGRGGSTLTRKGTTTLQQSPSQIILGLSQQQQQLTTPDRNNESETRESARMLVILENGEQRLITFTLPKESCAVQDLLEQVEVPFSHDTNISCFMNHGGNVDYIVTVGVPQNETEETVLAAERIINQSINTMRLDPAKPQTPQQQPTPLQSPHQSQQPQLQAIQNPTFATPTSQQQIHQKQTQDKFNQQMVGQSGFITSTPIKAGPQDLPKEMGPPPKYKAGFLAVCSACGITGTDFAKCERCNRIFTKDPKMIPVSNTVTPVNKVLTTATSTLQNIVTPTTTPGGLTINRTILTQVPKTTSKRQLEMIQKKHQQMTAEGGITRGGRGGRGAGRGRGRGRGVKQATIEMEPIILTLSSDDEAEDDKTKTAVANITIKNNSTVVKPVNPPTPEKVYPFEPVLKDDDGTEPADFIREDLSKVKNSNILHTDLKCRTIQIGTFKYDPTEIITFSTKGLRLVSPNTERTSEMVIVDIQFSEIVKMVVHFSKTLSVAFIYVLPSCSRYIREILDMSVNGNNKHCFSSVSRIDSERRIVLMFDSVSEESKSIINSLFKSPLIEDISRNDANELLVKSCTKNIKLKALSDAGALPNLTSSSLTDSQMNTTDIRQILIYPQGKGGISINTEDYMCLAIDQYLNDVIIDFYLNYLKLEMIDVNMRDKIHIFSTFFYKRLTTLSNRQKLQATDVKLTAAQKRHVRVKNWTKNVNLFERDFIIIPINEQSHWFLAIICFPALKEPTTFNGMAIKSPISAKKKSTASPERKKMSLQIGNTTITPVSKRGMESITLGDDELSERDEAEGDDSELNSDDSETEQEDPKLQPIKQPCILIFDSLAAGASRSRVVATLRDYLSCEFAAKHPSVANPYVYNKTNLPGHCVKVPQQTNYTDCGLYLLQYVEQFFMEPLKDYKIPIKHLQNWFETIVVTRKREDISNLLKKLIQKDKKQAVENLPEISFPTLDGKLLEVEEDENYDFEEDDMEEAEFEEEPIEEEDESAATGTGEDSSPEKIKRPINLFKRRFENKTNEPNKKNPRLSET